MKYFHQTHVFMTYTCYDCELQCKLYLVLMAKVKKES